MIIRDGEIISARPGSWLIAFVLTCAYLGGAALCASFAATMNSVVIDLFMALLSISLLVIAILSPFVASRRIMFLPDRIVSRWAFGTEELPFSEITYEQWFSYRGARSLIIHGPGSRAIHLAEIIYEPATLTTIHDEVAARCQLLNRPLAPPVPIPIAVKTLHHALSLYLGGMFAVMALIAWLALRHHTGA